MRLIIILSLAITGYYIPVKAGEGMWLPYLLDSLNYQEMKEKGLKITADEIYSITKPSIKDAVVIFANGCTGEVISPEGLVITNHHCGFSRIVSHSTVENNYLVNGFRAASQVNELANPGLSVTFLIRTEDVTARILQGVSDDMAEDVRMQKILANIYNVRNSAIENSHYQAEVKSFYFGKEYFLFIYEIFNDVRLVGTPPEAIGNFGGDSDNWIWPRHTGDFSLFRIYAGKDNKPADYSPENVPYKPKKYLNISLKGVNEGDFTMVMGYPSRTDQYLTSDALTMIAQKSLPAKIEMRTVRLNAINEEMLKGPKQKLQYASKHKSISNAWKKWIGIVKGVERADVIAIKKQEENAFNLWASHLAGDTAGYSSLMENFSSLYKKYEPIFLANDLAGELLNSIELSGLTDQVQIKFYESEDSSTQYKKFIKKRLTDLGRNYFRSSAVDIDRKVLPAMLKTFAAYMDDHFEPLFFERINNAYSGNYDAFIGDIFDHSMFTDSVRFFRTFEKSDKVIFKNIINDPLIQIYRDFSILLLTGESVNIDSLDNEIKRNYRKYVSAMMQMDTSRVFYPDANFSMRVTYGKVEGYQPADGVIYTHQSTLDGVFEKEDPDIIDYHVPAGLKDLYSKSDHTPYHVNGSVPVCFVASNHTSGGNSGSPVLDANGYLIGINFDRNWEGTVSDYAYDPKVCRNISVDIRYVLFIIDKLADADWILEELTLIN